MPKTIHIQYYALLREERGVSKESISTNAKDLKTLYSELQKKHKLSLSTDILRVALNNQYAPWTSPIKNQDSIVFRPAVTGG